MIFLADWTVVERWDLFYSCHVGRWFLRFICQWVVCLVLVQTYCSHFAPYGALQCSICSTAFIHPERSFISDSFMSPGHPVDSCGQLHSLTASLLIGLLWIPSVSVTVHRSGLPLPLNKFTIYTSLTPWPWNSESKDLNSPPLYSQSVVLCLRLTWIISRGFAGWIVPLYWASEDREKGELCFAEPSALG